MIPFDIKPTTRAAGIKIITAQAIIHKTNSTSENAPLNNANVYVSLNSLILVTLP